MNCPALCWLKKEQANGKIEMTKATDKPDCEGNIEWTSFLCDFESAKSFSHVKNCAVHFEMRRKPC